MKFLQLSSIENMTAFIKLATPSDATGIAKVHTDSWRSTYTSIVDDGYLNGLDPATKAAWWAQAIAHGAVVHVAVVDGQIVGFANGGKNREDGKYEGELYALYLLKEYQGIGIGTLLFDAVVSELKSKGITSMMVWVLRDNSSREFYIHQGGAYIRDMEIEIGGQTLVEEAYGWDSL